MFSEDIIKLLWAWNELMQVKRSGRSLAPEQHCTNPGISLGTLLGEPQERQSKALGLWSWGKQRALHQSPAFGLQGWGPDFLDAMPTLSLTGSKALRKLHRLDFGSIYNFAKAICCKSHMHSGETLLLNYDVSPQLATHSLLVTLGRSNVQARHQAWDPEGKQRICLHPFWTIQPFCCSLLVCNKLHEIVNPSL